eukprot:7638427-Pyramimonas_sp.AAC.1
MRLSFAWLSWSMSQPFGVIDDLGPLCSFTLAPPAVFKNVFGEAFRRLLEREAGAKCARDHRLRFDIVLEGLTSKKYSALDKGCVRAVRCNGVWPLARARAAGCRMGD